jgi:hypothetical protein
VRCACGLRDAVRSSGLEIRAGLHTGEIELIRDDLGGIAVNIGQRVSGLASAGEVLVSRTVVDLVAGSGLEFEDRGEHELKGVPGSWRLFQVVKGPVAGATVPGRTYVLTPSPRDVCPSGRLGACPIPRRPQLPRPPRIVAMWRQPSGCLTLKLVCTVAVDGSIHEEPQGRIGTYGPLPKSPLGDDAGSRMLGDARFVLEPGEEVVLG